MLKTQKEEEVSREQNMNETLNRLETELIRQKEQYRDLMSQNTSISNAYSDTLKEKERQANTIKDLKQSMLDLEAKITQANKSFLNKDMGDVTQLTKSHNQRREVHIESILKIKKQLEQNLQEVERFGDMKEIDSISANYNNRVGTYEEELQSLDRAVRELTQGNLNEALDVDLKRQARADFEGENLNLGDAKVSYDALLLEHNRLKGINQSLECDVREARAELRTLQQTQQRSS